ncbi:MAG TPA: hypothetical protein VFJ17_02650 [Mycobacteriales bacterium]|jgi:hypothetical protein|nr:hypothetical protein [Mycobacteriales bacterium]
MGDDAPWIDPVVVPDDIRALQADIDAYHRELRDAGRHQLVRRLTATRLWRRGATPVAILATALALAAVVFAVLTLGDPGVGRRALPSPIASAPAAAIGAVDGLLPDLSVRTISGEARSVRSLRPALVALVPQHCACAELVNSLAGQAETVGASLVAIAPAAQDAEVAALPGRTHSGQVTAYFDPAHALADLYRAVGVTLLVVAPDATVRHVLHDVQPGAHVEALLYDGIGAPGVVREGTR